MATTSDSSVSFEETDTESDEMNRPIEAWIDDLVAGDRTWQEEFDRYVQEGESVIWIWVPIIRNRTEM